MKEELLKEILRCSGKTYISDLSKGVSEPSVKNALQFVMGSGHSYELSEWKDAIDYITGGTVVLKDMDEIKTYIRKL